MIAERKKPRIVMIVASFPKLSETFIVQKFLGLLARGFDVHVVCAASPVESWLHFPRLLARRESRRRIRLAPRTRPRWIVLFALPALAVACWSRPRAAWRCFSQAKTQGGLGFALRVLIADLPIWRLTPDLIHFEFGALAAERPGLAARVNARSVVSFRGFDLNFSGVDQQDFYGRVFAEVDALHLLGAHLWQVAMSRGCPADKCHALIPPALDPARFVRPEQRRPGSLRILAVGRLEWKKGLEDVLVALAALRDRGIEFRAEIVGAGPMAEALYFARHQLGLVDQVELVGALPPAVVRDKLVDADIFLHLALTEGFCNAVLEAQAAGLAIVCSDAGGLPENVEAGVTALIVPRRDPQAAAEQIELLARDPELRRRLGEAGRQRVAARFTLESQLDAFEALYGEVLGR